jgi:hypothetical protein
VYEQTNAQLGYEGAVINADKALGDYDTTMKDSEATDLEKKQSTLDAKEAILRLGQQAYDTAGATEDAGARQVAALQTVAAQLAPGNPLRAWLEDYIWLLTYGIPREKVTEIAIRYNLNAEQLAGQIQQTANVLGVSYDAAAQRVADNLEAMSQGFYYAEGGVVPGPAGRPHMAMVHGGEAVFNPDQLRALGVSLAGGGTGGGGSVTLNATVYAPSGSGDDIVAALSRWVQNNGTMPARVKAAFA